MYCPLCNFCPSREYKGSAFAKSMKEFFQETSFAILALIYIAAPAAGTSLLGLGEGNGIARIYWADTHEEIMNSICNILRSVKDQDQTVIISFGAAGFHLTTMLIFKETFIVCIINDVLLSQNYYWH